MASTIKNSAGIDHHAGRVNLACDNALRLNLHPAFCEDHSVKAPRDDHTVSFNLTLDFGILSENHGLLGDDVSFNMPVDAERSCERQRAFERYTLVDETSPFLADTIPRRAGPLPCHRTTPKKIYYQFIVDWRDVNAAQAQVVECNS